MLLMIDLAKPYDLWTVFITLTDLARKHADDMMRQLSNTKPRQYQKITEAIEARFKDHKVCSLYLHYHEYLGIEGSWLAQCQTVKFNIVSAWI